MARLISVMALMYLSYVLGEIFSIFNLLFLQISLIDNDEGGTDNGQLFYNGFDVHNRGFIHHFKGLYFDFRRLAQADNASLMNADRIGPTR